MAVSEKLNNREVFPKTSWFSDEKYDKTSELAINKQVRRLVLLMRCIEESGRMPLDKTERCVIRAFEHAEMLYYGLTSEELKELVESEGRNAKGRARNQQGS